MSTPAHIRPSTVNDTEALTALLSELNREEGYDTSASADAIRAVLGDGVVDMRALVAEADKQIAGLVLYYWGYDTVSAAYGFHLADIIVTKRERGKGIGTALYKKLAEQCMADGGKWIALTVLKQNESAQRFYKRLGMVDVAVNFLAIGPEGLSRCAQGK